MLSISPHELPWMPDYRSEEAVEVAQLETSTRQLIDAINTRNYEHPIWNDMPQCFREGSHKGNFFYDTRENEAWSLNLLDRIKQVLAENSDFHITIRSISADVIKKAGYAEVFINSETTGYPAGIVHSIVTRLEYRLLDDRWMIVNHENLAGFLNSQ